MNTTKNTAHLRKEVINLLKSCSKKYSNLDFEVCDSRAYSLMEAHFIDPNSLKFGRDWESLITFYKDGFSFSADFYTVPYILEDVTETGEDTEIILRDAETQNFLSFWFESPINS